jgi:glyoxylase-like metal-dependent hydrolase (beta-lactamase superfamily II)
LTEFAAGIYRLKVPLPFAMEALNAWLVDSGDGWVLIDCGMHTAAAWAALQFEIAAAGVAWSDIRTVLITHMHPDHVGLAPQVKQASEATVAMHRRDAELLREFARPDTAEHWNGVALDLAGSPAALAGPVNAAFHLLTVKFPDFAPDLLLEGTERFGCLEAMLTPGHSPGHLCFLDHDRSLFFSGDHILETTSPNIGWLPDENPLAGYLRSLDEISKLEIQFVLPGHGEPLAGHREWIQRTTRHHMERLALIHQIVTRQAATAHQIAGRIWERALDPIHYRFAIFEVLAHLVYLRAQGLVHSSERIWSAR